MPNTANNNVISLDKYDSTRRESGNGPAIKALEAIRELCRQSLIRNVEYMMTRCDDALYGCAQMAESSIVQDLYLDAIDELKAISGDVEKHFIDRFIEQFNLGVPRGMLQLGTSEPDTERDDSDSAYHRNDRVSEDIAIYKMIEKTRDECAQILQSLDRRIGFLMRDPSLERCQNPLSPESICEAFRAAVAETVSQVKYGFEIRPILFNLFDQYVLGNMDVVYKELDIHLIKLRIQPQLNTNAQNSDSNTDMPGYQDLPLSNNAMPHSEPGACFVPEQIIIQLLFYFCRRLCKHLLQNISCNTIGDLQIFRIS